MKPNIVLVGLEKGTNLGDKAIYFCMENMVRRYLDEYGIDCEIRNLDLSGIIGKNNPFTASRNIYRRAKWHFDRKRYEGFDLACKTVEYFSNEMIDSQTRAVVFVGGGILKYRYQLIFLEGINAITRTASRRHVPVMFSAVGVEGYDESSRDCQRLKKALNRDCVKVITTRDDIDTLNEHYVEKDIRTAKVADPVVGIGRLIKKEKKRNCDTVGLGVIRFGLFTDNDISFSDEEMIGLWSRIYREVTSRGYKCRIFANGMNSDIRAAEALQHDLKENHNVDAEVLPLAQNVEELIDQITSFKGIVCGRLHGSVISYAYDVPSIGIVWNNKQHIFGKTIGYPERFMDVSAIDAGDVADRLETAMKQGYQKIDREEYIRTTEDHLFSFLNEYAFPQQRR